MTFTFAPRNNWILPFFSIAFILWKNEQLVQHVDSLLNYFMKLTQHRILIEFWHTCTFTGILRFNVRHIYFIFYKFKVCGNSELRRSIGKIFFFFNNSICSFCFSVSRFGNSDILNILIIIAFVMVICDQQSLILLIQLSEGSDDD